jgi:hypothetical protein
MIEKLCYSTLLVLTIANAFVALPIHLNITAFSLAIIIAGAKRSAKEMIAQFKAVHIEGKESTTETISKEEAMQFPLVAGGMLCGLYGLIKFFGKEIVNPMLLAYMGLGSSVSIKNGLLSFGIGEKMD